MEQGIKVVYTKYRKEDMRIREKVAKKKERTSCVQNIG